MLFYAGNIALILVGLFSGAIFLFLLAGTVSVGRKRELLDHASPLDGPAAPLRRAEGTATAVQPATTYDGLSVANRRIRV